MSYEFHRILCATPFELEAERAAFETVLAEFNASDAMKRGVLLVGITLVRMQDKRPYQAAVDDNLRSCSFYLQLLEDSWGPPERNFERDFALAERCAADPASPLREAVMLFKDPLLPDRVETAIRELRARPGALTFTTAEDFRNILRGLLTRWLEALAPPRSQTASGL